MQQHNTIFDLFNQIRPLHELDKDLLAEYWSEIRVVKRGENLLRPAQIERYVYFVLEGCLRIYFPNDMGEEICVGFGYSGNILSAIPSFLQEKPSEFGISALRKSKLLQISKQRLYELREKSPNIDKVWQLSMEFALIGLIERESAMLIQDPRERLRKLLQRSPHIFQQVPQKYIASYLRMSPETLSRIFKEQ